MSPSESKSSVKGILTGPVRQISIPLVMSQFSHETEESISGNACDHSEDSQLDEDPTVSTRTADLGSSLSSARDDDDINIAFNEALDESEAVDDVESRFSKMGVKRTVGFTTIQIREYPVIAGDNPSVMMGVPLTIDWTPVNEIQCPVDDYEQQRPKPRSMTELRMPASRRADLLLRLGYSRHDIREGIKVANIVRNRRKRTQETMKLSAAHEAFERMARATLNATVRRGAKSKERNFLRMSGVSSSSGRKGDKEEQLSLRTDPMEESSSFHARSSTIRPH